jgi:NAD(P) transhydrogenase subunit alpha
LLEISSDVSVIFSMRIAVLGAQSAGERRCLLTPPLAQQLVAAGVSLFLERDLGRRAGFPDGDYPENLQWFQDVLPPVDGVLCLSLPRESILDQLASGTLLMGFLDPFGAGDGLERLASRRLRAAALELLPRSTATQSMDALSSQSGLAGYAAVLRAATRLDRIVPMLVTPAGTTQPARFFVVGAGVAGLQAIATARRMGAVVEAFDTRPSVEEQVKSLGARFLKIGGESPGETAHGYAQELSEEQKCSQRRAMARSCERADAIITTARVFGRRSPLLIDRGMLAAMQPGSVVVDLAVATGGNVEGMEGEGEALTAQGVHLLGLAAAENDFPRTASHMLATNLANFLLHFRGESGEFRWNMADEILNACAIVDGETVRFHRHGQ